MGRGKLIYITLLVVLTLFTGCTTTKLITIPEYHYRDSIQVRTEVDSVLVHDSIFLSMTSRNDTVTVEKVVVRYRDRIRERVDTVFVVRVDTVTKWAQSSVKGEQGTRKAASLPQVLLMIGAVAISLLSIRKSINLK